MPDRIGEKGKLQSGDRSKTEDALEVLGDRTARAYAVFSEPSLCTWLLAVTPIRRRRLVSQIYGGHVTHEIESTKDNE